MRIGVPTEIKDNEYRVGMTPAGARDRQDQADGSGDRGQERHRLHDAEGRGHQGEQDEGQPARPRGPGQRQAAAPAPGGALERARAPVQAPGEDARR